MPALSATAVLQRNIYDGIVVAGKNPNNVRSYEIGSSLLLCCDGALFDIFFHFIIIAGTPVRIDVSMGVITISSLSEVTMVSRPLFFFLYFKIENVQFEWI